MDSSAAMGEAMKSSIIINKFLLIRVLLLALPIIFITPNTGDCTEDSYYTIHLASFKELQNANDYVNAMTHKGKTIFWKKADVPGKGEYYRVYMGKYKNRDEAVEFWKILKEEGAVSYFGVHEFKEETLSELNVEPAAVNEVNETDVVQTSIHVSGTVRFIDNGDGTVTDRKTNLMWIKNGWRVDFFSAVKWVEAIKKCERFSYGGYTDWRLPTIKEWKSLLDKNNEYPALVEPNPFENIIVHMPYWSRTEYISSRSVSMEGANRAYTVMLYYGQISHQSTKKLAFILPVRSLH
ncbi:MAG TPA: DUF1566 domain-containing protein [Desulfatiglandales bacterium]|nr:DUF1566 domain-containing protein [Desulfatiglandales bacterium]